MDSLLAGVGRGPDFDPPRPLRSGMALAALGLVPLVLGITGAIRPLSGLVFAGIFLVVGALRGALAYHDLLGLRSRADELLRTGARPSPHSPLLSWRAAELTSPTYRRAVARALTGIVRELEGRALPGAVPLYRSGARPHVDLIRALAERLGETDRPVTPQGIALVDDLLTDGVSSPLYDRERAGELRPALFQCLAALDASVGSSANGSTDLTVERARRTHDDPVRPGGER